MVKTLKGKFSIMYLCLVLLTALVGLVSAVNLYKLSKAINELMTDNYKSIGAVTKMLESLERQDSAMLIYMNMDRHKGIQLFSENGNEFMKWYNIEISNVTEQGEKEIAEKINDGYKSYTRLFSELQEVRGDSGIERMVEFYNNAVIPEFINLKTDLKALIALNEKSMFNSKDKATASTVNSVYITLAISALAVIGGYLAASLYANRLLKPLHTLTESIKLVRAGDLNHHISLTTQDETADLALEFNNMTRRLLQYEQSTLGNLMTEKNKSVAIVKSISDPLIVMDNSFRIMMVNNACEQFFGVTEEECLGRHFLEVIKEEEMFRHILNVMNADDENKETIVLLNRGEGIYFNVVATKIRDVETNVNGLIAVLHDVTHLKHLEKIKTDFVATISHEFKTPLTSIMMGASLIQDAGIGVLNARQKEIIDAITEDGERLSELVNDLLELSRIESEKAIFKMQHFSIAAVIEKCVKPLYETARQKEIDLYFETEDELPRVKADPEKISWVINNLIVNALKYTGPGDEICVSAWYRNSRIYVSVRDTGAGIPEEYVGRIFDKFVQVKGQDAETRGTGLGLSIVKEIIKAHGGEIWCESKLDQGSNFVFTLPLG